MCGIAGFWEAAGIREDDATRAVSAMADAIRHRGPDDHGIFVDPAVGLALGFRRLAILDLSQAGHQPMRSPAGRFMVVFNGEIYNHRALRADLLSAGVSFRGRSDTEVLAAGFEQWGVHETLRRARGMFAIAAWDSHDSVLSLARDRLGIKPLYLHTGDGYLSFGSELKTLRHAPRFRAELDREAVEEYLSLLYVAGPRTIWRHVEKVTPGTIVEFRGGTKTQTRAIWSLDAVARGGRIGGMTIPDAEAPGEIERVLKSAVTSHLESDVPLGAFLSGGIDSTTVVALMQEHSATPVRTFTVQFDDPTHDEAAHAEAVARHLGTNHTTLPVSGADALALVPRLPAIYDEPFADASQLPTLLVASAAREHVAVVLTGDGGDELFAGYNRYRFGVRAINRLASIPMPVRRGLMRLIDAAPAGSIDRAAAVIARRGAAGSLRLAEEKVRKFARLLPLKEAGAQYQSLISTLHGEHGRSPKMAEALQYAFAALPAATSLLDRMLIADQLGYLPENQMTKVDRASMAVSLEARVPLLDHEVVELSWRLSPNWLIRGEHSKWALRQLVYSRVPRMLLDRPKTGFSVPLAAWLRGPLRDWAEDLLSPSALAHGPLEPTAIRSMTDRLWRGHDDAALGVWATLQFEAWRRHWSM